jgi:branched-chain amino acid transport system substrate-binding protein
MRKGKFRIVIIASLAGVVLLSGISMSAEAKVLKWGTIVPMSGPAALWGAAMNQGARLAIEEFNDKGGVLVGDTRYKIELIEEDSKYRGSAAAAAAMKLINRDGVRYITGPLGSPTMMAAQPITEPNKCITLTNAWADILSKEKPYSFRQMNDVLQGIAGSFKGVSIKYPGRVKRVGIIGLNDVTGKAGANAVKVASKALNWQVVAEEHYERGLTDFNPLLVKILSKSPDLVDISGSPAGEVALICKQAYEMGYRGLKTGILATPKLIAEKGGQGAEGFVGFAGVDYDAAWITKGQKELYKKFKNKWADQKMLIQVEVAYTAAKGVLLAIEKAKTLDTSVVVDILENLKWGAPTGEASWVDFDSYGSIGIKRQILVPHPITELKEGKLELIFMADLEKVLREMGIEAK